MRFWIDCEWNDWQGELISIALVDADGFEFYRVVRYLGAKPWVMENVIPKLGRGAVSYQTMQQELKEFLMPYSTVHIIADWPEDIMHFCRALVTGPGERIPTPKLTMEIRRDIGSDKSKIPHQALADAHAMRLEHLALELGSNSTTKKGTNDESN